MSTHDHCLSINIEVSNFICKKIIDSYIFRKDLIEKPVNFLHLNLSIALLLGLILFVGGVGTAVSIPV